MKITNTNTSGVNLIKMLILGESGSGKTTLAGTIKEPTIILSAESGLLSLQDKKIDVIDLSKDDNGALIPKEKRMQRLGEAYKYLLSEDAKKYKWVFIDSLTELNQNILEALFLEFPDPKDTLKVYGELAKRMRSLVKSFRDLPNFNVVFTAISAVEKDENGMRFTTVDLVGNFAAKLPQFFDEVGFLFVKEGERFILTEKSERVIAKDRSGKLDKLEVADLSVIAAKINGTFNNNKEKETK